MGQAKASISEQFLVEALHLGDVRIQDACAVNDDGGLLYLELTLKGDAVPEDCDRVYVTFTKVSGSILVKYEPRWE